jgi:hypothetical protein
MLIFTPLCRPSVDILVIANVDIHAVVSTPSVDILVMANVDIHAVVSTISRYLSDGEC